MVIMVEDQRPISAHPQPNPGSNIEQLVVRALEPWRCHFFGATVIARSTASKERCPVSLRSATTLAAQITPRRFGGSSRGSSIDTPA